LPPWHIYASGIKFIKLSGLGVSLRNIVLLIFFLISELSSNNYNSEACKRIMKELSKVSKSYLNAKTEKKKRESFEEARALSKQLGLDISELLRDNLTELPNRHAFDSEVPRIFELVKRGEARGRKKEFIERNSNISVLLADLDDFKLVNDVYGHSIGDLVLKVFADEIRSVIRKTDFAMRFGGEEIIVVLPYTGKMGAMVLGETIRKRMLESQTLKEIFESLKERKLKELENMHILKVANTLEALLGRKIRPTLKLRLRIESVLVKLNQSALTDSEIKKIKYEFIDEIKKRLPLFQSVSLGVSSKKLVMNDDYDIVIKKLFKAADKGLLKSKGYGKNRVSFMKTGL
jgi:diguanylate cyclase (GGDEF)-like protein